MPNGLKTALLLGLLSGLLLLIGDLLGGFLSSPAGKAGLAGTAADAMKEVLGK